MSRPLPSRENLHIAPAEKTVADPDMRRVLDVLAAIRDENERLRVDAISAYGQAQDAYEQLQRLRAVCASLIVAYDAEESAHGFPFSFELRQAHRELCALINPTPEGESLLDEISRIGQTQDAQEGTA